MEKNYLDMSFATCLSTRSAVGLVQGGLKGNPGYPQVKMKFEEKVSALEYFFLFSIS